jgi:hypothetical protein
MAILDAELLFSKDQEVKSSVNSQVIDLHEPGDAVGQELTIRTIVSTAFAGLSSLQIKLQTGENGSDFTDVLLTPAIPAANLKKGAEIFCVRVPHGLKRYVRLSYVASGSGTAGKVYSYMSKEL